MTNIYLNAKPCPNCKRTDTVKFDLQTGKVVCCLLRGGCGTSGGKADTKMEAYLKWNTREKNNGL